MDKVGKQKRRNFPSTTTENGARKSSIYAGFRALVMSVEYSLSTI